MKCQITILIPNSSSNHGESLSSRTFCQTLDSIKDPIHPTEAFDMIVGTSTGGIIAMALLAGNEGPDGKRERMTVEDVKNIYLE